MEDLASLSRCRRDDNMGREVVRRYDGNNIRREADVESIDLGFHQISVFRFFRLAADKICQINSIAKKGHNSFLQISTISFFRIRI
ncbi:hypothetical protein P8452_11688 [Trifolium repens]|nr:hypothetical protein P8452_11688 [Trifolium repens]